MAHETREKQKNWVAALQEIIAPHLHQIPYGNIRSEFTQWQEEAGTVENLAIVYEMPGGSTNQINVTHVAETGKFVFLELDTHEECCTASLDMVQCMVKEIIDRIPENRKRRLVEDLDRWAEQGLEQRDLFQKMNSLLQIEDLRGGTITMSEMKHGIAHILAKYRTSG